MVSDNTMTIHRHQNKTASKCNWLHYSQSITQGADSIHVIGTLECECHQLFGIAICANVYNCWLQTLFLTLNLFLAMSLTLFQTANTNPNRLGNL